MMAIADATMTDFVAWYGAVLATASVAFGCFAIFRDKRKIVLRARANWRITEPFANYKTEDIYIYVTAANTGRRPVTLGNLAMQSTESSKSGWFVVGEWSPKSRLEEGESASRLVNQKELDLSKVKFIAVEDATGKVWKAKIESNHSKPDIDTHEASNC
ncbi:MAG: hypothetical protein ACI89L_000914 [Phycisphaerales bacterium]|jgi:hypothetical protein